MPTDVARLERRVECLLCEQAEAERRHQELMYAIAHDLNEPLRTVIGFADVIDAESPLDAQDLREYLRYMRGGVTQLQRRISGLLELSRVDSHAIEVEDVDLNLAVARAMQLLGAQGERIEVDKAELPSVRADLQWIQQLLKHLLSNAAACRLDDGATMVKLTVTVGESTWTMTCADDGPGIPAEHRESVFHPFRRLRPQSERSGAGLGLTICSRIVERLGGQIEVLNGGEGAVIRLVFPVLAAGG